MEHQNLRLFEIQAVDSEKQKNSGPDTELSKVCRVCSLPSKGIRCGVYACEACKKFFLRHRSKLSKFKCVTGLDDCVANNQRGATHPMMFSSAGGRYCVRCRLVKCFEIGMRVKSEFDSSHKSTSPPPSPSDQSSVVTSTAVVELAVTPTSREMTAVRDTLKMVMVGMAELSTAFQSMPWTVDPLYCPSDTAMWQYTMHNFNYLVSAAVDYVKMLEGFSLLPMPDRCRLFSQALVPLLAIQVTLPNRDPALRFFGMPPAVFRSFMQFFPMYKTLAEVLDEVGSLMNSWRPNFVEICILQAMIVFRTDISSRLVYPEMVCKLNRALNAALEFYLSSTFENPQVRKHFFTRIYQIMLHKLQGNYEGIINALAFSRPDLLHFNKLFADMYNLASPTACIEQYKVIGGPSMETTFDR